MGEHGVTPLGTAPHHKVALYARPRAATSLSVTSSGLVAFKVWAVGWKPVNKGGEAYAPGAKDTRGHSMDGKNGKENRYSSLLPLLQCRDPLVLEIALHV